MPSTRKFVIVSSAQHTCRYGVYGFCHCEKFHIWEGHSICLIPCHLYTMSAQELGSLRIGIQKIQTTV